MNTTAKLYYLAAALASAAALIYALKDGFSADEYIRVGLLAAMAVAMLLLGNRERRRTGA